jgi:uncharacterized protein
MQFIGKNVIMPEHQQALNYALRHLQNRLSPRLTYHNLWHTEDDVLPGCRRLADLTGVAEAERGVLEIAAAFHDIGFVESYMDHEQVGANTAVQILPSFGYSSAEIEQVVGMIMATRLPQTPHNMLEEIIADADLDVLGRPDFLARNGCLREELANYGREIPLPQWYESQLAFLENHTYFTWGARQLRNEQKRQNMALLRQKCHMLL